MMAIIEDYEKNMPEMTDLQPADPLVWMFSHKFRF